MMYIHYCPSCGRIHILNGHKSVCPTCDRDLTELEMPYMDYVEMNLAERNALCITLQDPAELKKQKARKKHYKPYYLTMEYLP